MRQITYKILILCLLSAFIVSCKPKQQIVYSSTPIEDKEHNRLFADIIGSEFPYHTLSARLNINLTAGSRSLNSKGSFRVVRDSTLQISVQPLFGVEMFRFHIDRDSLVLLDRMNKRYVKESIASLKELYPVGFDFYALQSLFTNALFVSGKPQAEEADYRAFTYSQTSGLQYYLASKDAESGIEYSFTVNGDDRITFAHLMQPKKKYSLQWSYGNFAVMGNNTFPHKMDVGISTSSRKVNTELVFSNIIIDEPIHLSMNIPSSYTRTSVSEILKILTSNQ